MVTCCCYSFEFSVELLDLMDDIMNMQLQVFHQLERSHDNSMTGSGQCKLYPLILAIQDSCQLYDCLVKMLFKLHKGTAAIIDIHYIDTVPYTA